MSAAAVMRPSTNFASTKAFCNSSATGAPSGSVRSPLERRRRLELHRISPRVAQRLDLAGPAGLLAPAAAQPRLEIEAFGLHRELGAVAREPAARFRGCALQRHAVRQAQARRARGERCL